MKVSCTRQISGCNEEFLPQRFFGFWSRAHDSISHFVGPSVGRSLFTTHATYGDRPCFFLKEKEKMQQKMNHFEQLAVVTMFFFGK